MKIDNYLRTAATAVLLAACLVFSACSEKVNREDFAQMIKHKSEAEVLKYAGKPDAKDEQKGDRHVWTYNQRTFNVEKSNKFDDRTIVIFTPGADGKMTVADVKFE